MVPQLRLLPLHLIDEPEVAMRSDVPDGYIQELAADIKRNGLTNAIAVRGAGGRYRIIAGHCRFLAYKHLGKDEIEAKDYTGSPVEDEAIKFGENFYRQDVSDADMAIYLSDVQEKYHYTLEQLQAITGRSEHWISQRLQLFNGDKEVFDALRAGLIKLGHAVELNKFPDAYRRQYLEIVINSTPPLRVLEDFHRQLKAAHMPPPQPATEQTGEQTAAVLPGVVVDACQLCEGNAMPWTMKFYRIHEHCFVMIVKALKQEA